jgi:hypothetical protein
MKQEERRQIERRLFESNAGYELVDVIAQANVNLDEIAAEDFDSMVVQFSLKGPATRWQLSSRRTA